MALWCFSKEKNVAKWAWKTFPKKLRCKFRDLEIAASVRDSIPRLLRVIYQRPIVPFKTRYLRNTISRTHFNNEYSYSHSHDRRQGSRFLKFSYRPFAKTKRLRRQSERNYLQACQYQSQRWRQGAIWSEEKVLGLKQEKEEEEGAQETVDSREDAWRRVVAASPHLRVDERSGEFISEFKEKMRLEKERSFLAFQEMLK